MDKQALLERQRHRVRMRPLLLLNDHDDELI